MFGFGRSDVKTVSPADVKDRMARREITLVDVREPGEWAMGRIEGAIHAPMSDFQRAAGKLPTDKPIVFYCLSAARSAQAVSMAKRLGLSADTHMAGGLSAWRAHGFPLVR